MIPTDKICKVYVAQVKSMLPVWGKSERKFVRKLHENLSDYCVDNGISVIDQLYKGFGTPQEIVFEYISLMKPQEISKRINTAKYIKALVVSLISISLIVTALFGVHAYAKYRIAEFAETTHIEHVIVYN